MDGIDQRRGILAAADDHRAAFQPAIGGPVSDQCAQRHAERHEDQGAARIPADQPDPANLVRGLEHEGEEAQQHHHHRPDRQHAAQLLQPRPIDRNAVRAAGVEQDVGQQHGAQDHRRVEADRRAVGDVAAVDGKAQCGEKRGLDHLRDAHDDGARHGRFSGLRDDPARRLGQQSRLRRTRRLAGGVFEDCLLWIEPKHSNSRT